MKKFFCFINFDRLRRAATLYVTFFKIALLVVGGGYAIIAAAQEEFVTRRRWITDDEMLDVITVTQTVPGIIACNSAVCIGWRIAGVVGALAAALGAITPSVAIIALIAAGMSRLEDFLAMPAVQGAFRCVIAAIVAMVVTVGIKLGKKAADSPFAWAVAILSFVGMSIFKISPVWLIVGAIAAGEIYSLIRDLNMRRRHGSR